MVIVFDLDDTLYDELTFVRSGFRAVAAYLKLNYQLPLDGSICLMNERLKKGRNHIFDDLLRTHNIFSQRLVKKCVSVYRTHTPEIFLYPEASCVLDTLKSYPLYIVTDGNKIVQKNKLIALGLYNRMNFCFVTHNYGIKNAKPSPYCFLKICQREQVSPQQVIYIADNPKKDFVNIKSLGFRTIRILQGQHKDVKMDARFEAEYTIQSLTELQLDFLSSILNNVRI